MKKFIIKQCPDLGKYLLIIMMVYMTVQFNTTTVFAAGGDMWAVANKIIVDVYTKIAGISTVLAGLMSAMAVIAAGWALLIGNLVFKATKSMATGLGFEGEDPKILFCRTFVFGFLLLASREICEVRMSISNKVITLLQVPQSVTIPSIDDSSFGFDSSWLLVIIVGLVLIFQIVKFFFAIGERYVIVAVLTIFRH